MKYHTKSYTIKRERFLSYLADTCNVSRSCRLAGVDRSDMYKLRKSDENFAYAWDQAKELGIGALEDEMHRRAFEGTLVTNQYGTRRKYSDVLAIFLLKAHKPDKYCDRYRTELSGPKGAVFNLNDPKVTSKLNSILNAAMARKT